LNSAALWFGHIALRFFRKDIGFALLRCSQKAGGAGLLLIIISQFSQTFTWHFWGGKTPVPLRLMPPRPFVRF